MKVAYLLGSLNRGGTETLMLDVFQNANKVDFEMCCIYRKEGQLSTEFKGTGVPLYRLTPRKLFIFQYFYQLRHLLKNQKINIVHAQQALDAIYARIACLFSSRKVVLTFHGFPQSGRSTNLLYKMAFACSHSIIFVSKYQKQLYEKKFGIKISRKSTIVYNGISFSKLENYSCHSIREELKITDNVLLLGMVGNFVAGRDPMTICRFLKLLKQQGILFHFLFIGKKNEAEPWRYDNCEHYCQEKDLSENVSFLGSRTDVPNILHQLDAFVYATGHDTFGIAVIEAIAAGIPVFVNNWPVMEEITLRGELATPYKTKDEADLLKAFMLFLQNKDIYLHKAKQSSALVKKLYHIERHIDELEKLYTHLLTQ